jgi:hypothetical protein
VKISNKTLRDAQRVAHLLGALVVVAAMYTPLRDVPTIGWLVEIIAIPVLVGTGLAMWQLPRLRKLVVPRDRTRIAQH